MNSSKALKRMITNSLLSVIAFLIMYIAFPLPIFPQFLTIDFSDVPAIIGALLFGPVSGMIIEAMKNLLHYLIVGSLTGVPIGELSNFAAGTIFIFASTWFYHRTQSVKGLIFGLILGTVLMTIIMSVANYYIIFPSYAMFLHFPIDAAVKMASAANRHITDLYSLIIYGIAPFNIVKGIFITILMIPLYIRLRSHLKKLA